MQNLTTTISYNLAKLRRQKSLTLDKLADLSGVSKAMISQIERGDSNPTVNVLWKIAAALHVPFGQLLNDERPPVKLVRHASCKSFASDDASMHLLPLFSFDEEKHCEIFSVVLAAQANHHAPAREADSEEYVLLNEGTLEVEVKGETYTLHPGDAIRFHSDSPHQYRNPAIAPARFQNIIFYAHSH